MLLKVLSDLDEMSFRRVLVFQILVFATSTSCDTRCNYDECGLIGSCGFSGLNLCQV